jgi:hypothetical protein
MKKKVIDALDRKEAQLLQVRRLLELETNSSTLFDLEKNEIEIKAQISILKHLLFS